MKLWKVNNLILKGLTKERKIYTKDNIESVATLMEPSDLLEEYFDQKDKEPKNKYLHIFIQPLQPSSATTGKCLSNVLPLE